MGKNNGKLVQTCNVLEVKGFERRNKNDNIARSRPGMFRSSYGIKLYMHRPDQASQNPTI